MGERTDEHQTLVNDTADAVYTLGLKYGDIDFIAKMSVVSIALLTQVLHDKDPHTEDEDPDEACRHAEMIRAMLSFHLASGFAHRQYGPAELMALLRATATALALGLSIDGFEMSPAQILGEALSGFSTNGWEESKQSLMEGILQYRDEVRDETQREIEEGSLGLPDAIEEYIQRQRDRREQQGPMVVNADSVEEMFRQIGEQLGIDVNGTARDDENAAEDTDED